MIDWCVPNDTPAEMTPQPNVIIRGRSTPVHAGPRRSTLVHAGPRWWRHSVGWRPYDGFIVMFTNNIYCSRYALMKVRWNGWDHRKSHPFRPEVVDHMNMVHILRYIYLYLLEHFSTCIVIGIYRFFYHIMIMTCMVMNRIHCLFTITPLWVEGHTILIWPICVRNCDITTTM